MLILAILLPSSFVFAQAEGEGEGETDNVVADRRERDTRQTGTESETLTDLQQQDYEQCTAEVNGSSPGSGTPGTSGTPGSPGTPGTSGASGGNEEEVREKLREKGIIVNKGDCHGQAYQLVSGGCTDVNGLPQHSIDRLGELSDETDSQIILTGGTEKGHSVSAWGHAPGNNVVDLQRNNSSLNNYIDRHTTATWSSDVGTWHQLDNGDLFLDEGDHWHCRLQGTTGGTTVANLKKTSEKLAEKIWSLIKLVVAPVAQAVSGNLSVIISGQIVDLGSISNTELNGMISGWDQEETNRLFGSLNSEQSRVLTGQLSFSNLNSVFNNLDSENLGRLTGFLDQNTLNQIVPNLTSEVMDQMINSLNTGSLNGLINNMSDQALSTLFGNLSTDAIDSVINNLSGGIINDLVGDLSQGAIGNIFNQVSDDLVNGLVDSLGISSLNQVFSQLGGQTLNSVLGDLSGDVLNSVLPNLGQNTLTEVFTQAAPEVLDDVLSQVAPDVAQQAAALLPDNIVNDLAGKIPGLDEALGDLGVPDLGDIVDDPLGAVTGAGLYVPVVEQNGQLMQLTSSIDTTEKQIKDLSIQICTHLKAIRRIQVKFENTLLEDSDAMRIRATELDKYRQALFDLLKKGYTDNEGNENSGPLFVANTREHWTESSIEGTILALDVIKNSDNRYKEDIVEGIYAEWGTTEQNLTDEEYSLLRNNSQSGTSTTVASNKIPFISSLVIKPIKKVMALVTGNSAWAQPQTTATADNNYDDWWNAWLKYWQPRNNRNGSYLIAVDKTQAAQQEALEIAQHETLAAQDFLPVRSCAEWTTTEPKACKKWVTETPGILVKESGAAGLNSRLTQYENAKHAEEVSKGNEPNIEEIITLKPSAGGGGAEGRGMNTPAQMPQTSEQRQSDANTNLPTSPQETTPEPPPGNQEEVNNAWNDIIESLDFTIENGNDPSGNNWLQSLIELLIGLVDEQKPLVYFKAKDKDNNQSLLTWLSPNADSCQANNNWLSQEASASNYILKRQGESLDKSDSLTVTFPAGISATTTQAVYKIKCQNGNGSTEQELTINKE